MGDLPRAKKSLGQHWLTDRSALEDIIEAAGVTVGDNVLEIGPGTGTLTEVLLDYGASVFALEFDQDAINPLKKKFIQQGASDQIIIEQGDIRSFDFAQMPENYKIVANIPYYLTANLFRALIDTPAKPSTASLLVQKEVAERVTAGPGKLSFIAVALQLYYETDTGEVVPAFLFTPPPKVDSQVLILKKRAHPLYDVETGDFFKLVKAGFGERRKMLKSALKSGLEQGIDVLKLLNDAGVNPSARAQELSLEQWHQMYNAYKRLP